MSMKPTMGSLFAGIGGFDLGFERAGFKTVWQVEIDPWARKVLAKNFPDAERFEDVRTVGAHNLSRVDVICGGFPCQDISLIGQRAGIVAGEQSSLWNEMLRILCELRPRYAVIENVAAIVGSGLDVVLCGLAENGFDADWETLSAAAVGAPHFRDRAWIIAYPQEKQRVYKPVSVMREAGLLDCETSWWGRNPWDEATSRICRVDDGIPEAVRIYEALGNAVVPQIPEMYARRIKQFLEASAN